MKLQKHITLGALFLMFILSITISPILLATMVQLVALVSISWYAYENFGDQMMEFYQQLRGEDERSTTANPREPGGQDVAIAAADAGGGDVETEGQRDPS